jgi:hypothetical protein
LIWCGAIVAAPVHGLFFGELPQPNNPRHVNLDFGIATRLQFAVQGAGRRAIQGVWASANHKKWA